MAFDFGKMANKVTDKMTKLGQEASTMTKNVTENVKINSAISEQKKVIESMYTLIGRKYYQKYSMTPESDFDAEVSNIRSAIGKINDLERKLSEVKGSCPSCGAKITSGALFCTSCGAKLSEGEGSSVHSSTETYQQVQHHTVNTQTVNIVQPQNAGSEIYKEGVTQSGNNSEACDNSVSVQAEKIEVIKTTENNTGAASEWKSV